MRRQRRRWSEADRPCSRAWAASPGAGQRSYLFTYWAWRVASNIAIDPQQAVGGGRFGCDRMATTIKIPLARAPCLRHIRDERLWLMDVSNDFVQR